MATGLEWLDAHKIYRLMQAVLHFKPFFKICFAKKSPLTVKHIDQDQTKIAKGPRLLRNLWAGLWVRPWQGGAFFHKEILGMELKLSGNPMDLFNVNFDVCILTDQKTVRSIRETELRFDESHVKRRWWLVVRVSVVNWITSHRNSTAPWQIEI